MIVSDRCKAVTGRPAKRLDLFVCDSATLLLRDFVLPKRFFDALQSLVLTRSQQYILLCKHL